MQEDAKSAALCGEDPALDPILLHHLNAALIWWLRKWTWACCMTVLKYPLITSRFSTLAGFGSIA